ncbi:uncharacterized protein LOC123879462 [Maniola jurtina]|uniref:uncharacterized protein LOC123879462 n=1 Tax=Maniola jurtina TaxID=191418 RepID=UPI001E68C4E7|nr:uncharacterized protein LOC123879462 [Maniola jurtina]
MSGYLWGIAQLVNDPSNDLVNALRKSIVGQPQQAESANTHKATNNENAEEKELQKSISLSARTPKTSGVKVKEETTLKSKGIQVGQQPNKHHVAVQSLGPTYPCDRKTTSVQYNRQVPLFDRGTSTFITATTDAYTEPVEKKICKEHKDVIFMLKNWSIDHGQDSTDSNLITKLKKRIKGLINLLKIEKIQSIPEYYGPEKQIKKLYQEASCNKLDKKKT